MSSTSLDGLIRWLGRGEWREPFDEVLWLHLGPACERAGIETEELAGLLSPHRAMTLWGCAFEDFLTRTVDQAGIGQGGRNIVDDYLKRLDMVRLADSATPWPCRCSGLHPADATLAHRCQVEPQAINKRPPSISAVPPNALFSMEPDGQQQR